MAVEKQVYVETFLVNGIFKMLLISLNFVFFGVGEGNGEIG
jgi:hypothetical protein